MIDALYIANTGLKAQQTQLDIISNNVVNMNTPGFKKSRVDFANLAYQNANLPEVRVMDSENAALVGGGISIATTRSIFSPGDARTTGNPLDVAIHGNGFFEVMGEDGELGYTRAGRLGVDRDGFLVTSSGQRLSAGIQVPPDAEQLEITETGEVRATLVGESEPISLGQIDLARFTNTDGLNPLGNSTFSPTRKSGDAYLARPGEAGVGTLHQGQLEVSNVELVEEMSHLMLAQRAYQLNARLLQASDQILETINNLRR